MLYAIAMADYDQDAADSCEKLLTTRDGIKSIALYLSSIKRSLCLPEPFLEDIFFYGVYTLLCKPLYGHVVILLYKCLPVV